MLNNTIFVFIVATIVNIVFVNILSLFKLNIAQKLVIFIVN